jgi:dsDNA-specific endonuclease/ATPase MutS2
VGKGRLRAELDALLRRHPHVKGHHHGYFAKYGFGATEVELGD